MVQLCPALNTGGVERGVVDVAVYLKQTGWKSLVISNGGALVSELEMNNIQHIKLPIHSKNPMIFLLNLWRLKQLLKVIKPDLLLPYSRIPSWLVFFLCKKTKIPFVSHCLGIHQMGSLGIKKKYNSVLMRGDHVVANSIFTKDYFLNHYPWPPQQITVIPRSVDITIFNQKSVQPEVVWLLREQWNVGANKCVVVLPARFTSWKGHEVLINALGLIKAKHINDVYVVMVGDYKNNPSYYQRLLKLINHLDVSDDVFFAGASFNMRDVYAAADVVVSASTEPEAFGRVIIEAQAMRKLVVASQHGGAVELIEDQETGFLVEPGNPIKLAEKLMLIRAMAPAKKLALAINAEKSAVNFSKEKMCARLMVIFEALIEKKL